MRRLSLEFPADFMAFKANDELAFVASTGLVEFGVWGKFCKLCVDLKSGEVVSLLARPGRKQLSPEFVNSSLRKFTQVSERLIERFPYYGKSAEIEDCEAVAAELSKGIRKIDPSAIEPDFFWANIVDDISFGNFQTESFQKPEAGTEG